MRRPFKNALNVSTAEGRFGFPRLTTLGPLVDTSEITPFKDIEPGSYSLEDIEKIQSVTGEDTRRALGDIIEFDLELYSKEPDDVVFEYRTEKLSTLLEVNDFSSAILTAMSKAEEEGIRLEADETERHFIENEELEKEVVNHMDGKQSIFTDDLLTDITLTWQRIQDGNYSSVYESESELRSDVVDEVIRDFHRVMIINDSIRDSGEYFPPTTENISLGAPVGWGTIDGAHRIVALSQIIGTDVNIFIWEWSNEESMIEHSDMF